MSKVNLFILAVTYALKVMTVAKKHYSFTKLKLIFPTLSQITLF